MPLTCKRVALYTSNNNHVRLSLCSSQVSSKESRSGSQVPPELTGAAEPVASKRNLFEAGDAWIQNAAPATPSKVLL